MFYTLSWAINELILQWVFCLLLKFKVVKKLQSSSLKVVSNRNSDIVISIDRFYMHFKW